MAYPKTFLDLQNITFPGPISRLFSLIDGTNGIYQTNIPSFSLTFSSSGPDQNDWLVPPNSFLIKGLSTWNVQRATQTVSIACRLAFQDILTLNFRFPNLERLEITSDQFSMALLREMADHFPKLWSLKVWFTALNLGGGEPKVDEFAKSILKHPARFVDYRTAAWRLHDLTLQRKGETDPAYPIMIALAQAIPSIQSFCGRGDRVPYTAGKFV
ncbi:hypothetical protein DL96DRAFT_1555016 [Flagelloscypha sp. PMI_526]|nr:hypothetical protein DL96DRAFT_1555016 [Flagelloscypha sp. PMI_526]